MNTILMYLVYLPGLKELVLLLAVAIVLKLSKKASWPVAITKAIIISSILWGLFYFGFNLFNHNRFLLLPSIYFAMAVLGWFCLRHPSAQKLSLLLAMILYAVLNWQLTFVHRPLVIKTTWEIGADNIIKFSHNCHFHEMRSPTLQAYLTQKGSPEADLTIWALYHYGSLAGTNVDLVDGQHYPLEQLGAGTNCPVTTSPYPPYSFALRGLRFSQMYEGWVYP